MVRTSCPSRTALQTNAEPMNPAPPVAISLMSPPARDARLEGGIPFIGRRWNLEHAAKKWIPAFREIGHPGAMASHRHLDQRLKVQHFRAVEAIAAHGSLLKAATALSVTQPALS